MNHPFNILFFCLTACILNSCLEQDPNLTKSGQDELKSLEIDKTLDKESIHFKDIIYVPIYSDIYIDTANPQHLLSATLSIRNTSFNDTLYVSKIDYYDTNGSLARQYIDKTISINPMGTVNYVIEKEDTVGGSGANFIIELRSKSYDINPLIQAIMIGQLSNKSFSFSTDGYSITPKKPEVKNQKD